MEADFDVSSFDKTGYDLPNIMLSNREILHMGG
jgi:hypothetical protein